VREDQSGHSEDSEDDEMPCVIGESEGVCICWGLRNQWGVCSIDKVQHTKKSD